MALKLMYITNQPRVAEIVDRSGVDFVFVDMETLGKAERQRFVDSVKSHHTVEDIIMLRPVVRQAELLVRVNPIHDGSKEEIDQTVAAGADVIMLPMWKTASEVEQFLHMVGGRCKTMLLLENKEAERCLDEVLQLSGIDMIHIGLNDLHLSYQKQFMFELLADGTVERICEKLHCAGITYGFGGIGQIGGGTLPAQYILGEHIRLGSRMAILSRSFCDTSKTTDLDEIKRLFTTGIAALREREAAFHTMSQEELEENRKVLCHKVEEIVRQGGNKK